MSYVFVSHASEDKITRVKPLIEALAIRGVKLWLDRPGYGDSHFNFDQKYIDNYGIRGLRTGKDWDDQILSAIKDAGAVLACLSRSLCSSRQVLVQELLLAKYSNKLVVCIVDDLEFSEIPQSLGLADASKIQAERINPEILRKAVEFAKDPSKSIPQELVEAIKQQWEIVGKLVKDIKSILDIEKSGFPSQESIDKAIDIISSIPISPSVRFLDIPDVIVDILIDAFDGPEKTQSFVLFVLKLVRKCHPDKFTDKQITFNKGDIVSPFNNPLRNYWEDVLSLAGIKSRRTLAALFLAPGAPKPELLCVQHALELSKFLDWLKNPNNYYREEQ